MPFYLFETWNFECEECGATCSGERAIALGSDWYNPAPDAGWLLLQDGNLAYRCYCPAHRERGTPVESVEVNPERLRDRFVATAEGLIAEMRGKCAEMRKEQQRSVEHPPWGMDR